MGYYGSIKEVPSPEATYGCNCVDGRCSDCGNCCADILPLTAQELRRIKEYAKKRRLKEHRQAPFFDLKATDFTCPFRNQTTRRCDIYPVRPEICRSFICSKPLDVAHADRDRIYEGRREYSLRYEVFGNREILDFIATLTLRKILGL